MNKFFNNIKQIFVKSKGLFSLGFAAIVTNGIGGLFWLYMASLLTVEDYGKITYFISIAIISSTISLAGMTNTMTVFRAKGEKIQSTVYLIGIISPIITSLILYVFFIQDIIISLYVVGYVLFTLVTAELIGLKSYVKYSKSILIQKILLVVFAIGLYHVMGFGGLILGMALSFLPFLIVVFKSFKNEKVNFTRIKTKINFVVNSYLLDLANAFNGSLDKIIIAPILGYALLGNYQLGLQFLALLSILPGIFYQYILPQDSTGDSTKTVKKIMILISVLIAVGSVMLSPFLIPKLFPNFVEAIEVIQIMSISIISSTIISTYVSKYLGLTKSKIVIIGSGIYLLVQIPTLLIFSQYWGINGAAISLLIASIIHAVYFIAIDNFFKRTKIDS
jgi:O-antigen/teichoic acid export membrane protein